MKSGKVGASVSVMPDVTKLDWEKNSEKTIKLFGKDYEVGYIEEDLNEKLLDEYTEDIFDEYTEEISKDVY